MVVTDKQVREKMFEFKKVISYNLKELLLEHQMKQKEHAYTYYQRKRKSLRTKRQLPAPQQRALITIYRNTKRRLIRNAKLTTGTQRRTTTLRTTTFSTMILKTRKK